MWLHVENQNYQDDLNVYINGVYNKYVYLFKCTLSWMSFSGENKYVGSSQHRNRCRVGKKEKV